MNCDHDLAERETACADGMCPLCLQQENARLRAEQRDAFEAGFNAGPKWFSQWIKGIPKFGSLPPDEEIEAAAQSGIELAWEHFQAERMKAATEPESCG